MHGLCPRMQVTFPPKHTHIEKSGGGYQDAKHELELWKRFYQENEVYIFCVKLLKRPPRCGWVPQNHSSSSRWRSCRSQLVEWQLKAEHVVWINTLPRVQPNSGGRQDLRLPCDDRHIRLIIVLLLTHITFTCTVEFPRFFLLVLQKV